MAATATKPRAAKKTAAKKATTRQRPKPVTAASLDARELVRVLSDALLFAGDDHALPVLCAVLLIVKDGHLFAVCTDRYRITEVWQELDEPAGEWTFLMSRQDAELLIRTLKPFRDRGDVQKVAAVTLACDGDTEPRLTVTRELFAHAPRVSFTFTPVDGTYPAYAKLMDEAAKGKGAFNGRAAFALNPKFAAVYSKMASVGRNDPIQFDAYAPNKPVVVSSPTAKFRALIMPVRLAA